MDKRIIDYLEKLELSEIEAKLYATLLTSGAMTVRELARKTGIIRTSAYPHIDMLLEKELIIKIVKGSRTQVAVNAPVEKLQCLIEQKTQDLRTIKEDFPMVTKMIHDASLREDVVEQAEIRHYKGKFGVKKIYEEALQANELRAYAKLSENEEAKVFSNNIAIFTDAFERNPQLVVKELLYDSPLAKEKAPELLAKNNRYFYKFMPSKLKLSSEDILIYDGTVAFINYKGNISSIVLKNIDNYRNAKELFDFIWEILP
jgi:sugar-specific transcriptional regulator TrmB